MIQIVPNILIRKVNRKGTRRVWNRPSIFGLNPVSFDLNLPFYSDLINPIPSFHSNLINPVPSFHSNIINSVHSFHSNINKFGSFVSFEYK